MIELSEKALANMNKYLNSAHCKMMDKLWTKWKRGELRTQVYSDWDNIQVRDNPNYFNVTPVK